MDDLSEPMTSPQRRSLAIVLGTNEIASAVAARLAREGYCVVMSHDPTSPVLRRGMSFHDALFDDRAELGGVVGRRAETALDLLRLFDQRGCVAVTRLPMADLVTLRVPEAIVDASLQRSVAAPDLRGLARLSVGLGPRFEAGRNCDVAIETQPATSSLSLSRDAEGHERQLGGVGRERFFFAPRSGIWRTPLDIGAKIYKGVVLGRQEGVAIVATMDGILRGVARDGAYAPIDAKLIEIDPRGRAACWTGTDDYGRAIAAATADAVIAASEPPNGADQSFELEPLC
ncbi:MAG TPA: xanthine dehydrogenase [Methylocystis sp.]|nr:xanthine dehydrogenase [Methylocystis sp.]